MDPIQPFIDDRCICLQSEIESLEYLKAEEYSELEWEREKFIARLRTSEYQETHDFDLFSLVKKISDLKNIKFNLKSHMSGLETKCELEGIDMDVKVYELLNQKEEENRKLQEEEEIISNLKNEMDEYQQELSRLRNNEALQNLKKLLHSLEEEKIQSEDCVLGLRSQLPKLENEERRLSLKIDNKQKEILRLKAVIRAQNEEIKVQPVIDLSSPVKSKRQNQNCVKSKCSPLPIQHTVHESSHDRNSCQMEPAKKRGRPRKQEPNFSRGEETSRHVATSSRSSSGSIALGRRDPYTFYVDSQD